LCFVESILQATYIIVCNVYGYVLSKVRNPASNICLDTLNKDEKVEFELGLFHCQGGKSSAEVEITVVLSDEYNFNSCHFLVAVNNQHSNSDNVLISVNTGVLHGWVTAFGQVNRLAT